VNQKNMNQMTTFKVSDIGNFKSPNKCLFITMKEAYLKDHVTLNLRPRLRLVLL
jgi:hypothetical protein